MMTTHVPHNQTDTPQARLSLVRCGRIRSCDWPITCCLAAANDGSSSYDSKRPAVHPAGRWISEGARLVRNVNGRGGRCRAWASVPARSITSYSQARASEPVDGYRGRSRGDATIRTARMARAVAVRCGGPGGQFLARLDRVISRRGFLGGGGASHSRPASARTSRPVTETSGILVAGTQDHKEASALSRQASHANMAAVSQGDLSRD